MLKRIVSLALVALIALSAIPLVGIGGGDSAALAAVHPHSHSGSGGWYVTEKGAPVYVRANIIGYIYTSYYVTRCKFCNAVMSKQYVCYEIRW